ncbi:tyrosine-type recombinase/integrase, partial [Escherichia coli]|uniref:tyrosine-type recombinase/integrase n=1 Tax=Escherichia coli TaxID=562 RepID=UPI0023AF06AB
KRAYCLKTQPATGETYPKSDLFNKAPHMLRHACGYELAERGADTRLIQDYLGHRNIRHTVRYTASNAARFAGLWERNNLINEKLKREEV